MPIVQDGVRLSLPCLPPFQNSKLVHASRNKIMFEQFIVKSDYFAFFFVKIIDAMKVSVFQNSILWI